MFRLQLPELLNDRGQFVADKGEAVFDMERESGKFGSIDEFII